MENAIPEITKCRQISLLNDKNNQSFSIDEKNQIYKLYKMKFHYAPEVVKDDFEVQQMKKRITELEKQLKDAELKAIAFSTMVYFAEQDFKIVIRKKCNTNPYNTLRIIFHDVWLLMIW